METKDPLFSAPPDHVVISTRVFPHSRQLVFEAWTDPSRLKNWWGPHGFSNTFHEFDFRPGGKWTFTMHGPDGTDYDNEIVFVRIDPPELIILDHLSHPQFQVVATFEELQETKTKLTFRMIFKLADHYHSFRSFVQEKNEENFDRLEMELQRDDFLYT